MAKVVRTGFKYFNTNRIFWRNFCDPCCDDPKKVKEHESITDECNRSLLDRDLCAEAREQEEKLQRKPIMRDETLKCSDDIDISQICLDMKDPDAPDPCAKKPKVVIIGAGMAGLSAASRLIECGFEDIIILEATDRVGGRIFTGWMGDTVIELGPELLYGACLTNSVYNMAISEGIFSSHQLQRVMPEDINYLMDDGRIEQEHVIQDMVITEVLNEMKYLTQKSQTAEGLSVLQYMALRTQQKLQTFPPDLRYDTERMFYGLINCLKGVYGAEIDEVSAVGSGKLLNLPGGNLRIPGGFVTLLAPLIRNIPREYIKYNKAVTQIKWSIHDDPRVSIHCTDGTEYDADFVIVTVSLGVLKERMDCMFVPELPLLKQEAINALGMGHINRIFLEYIAPWWAGGECNIRVAWDKDILSSWQGWTRSIGTITESYGSRHVLSLTVGGRDAVDLEMMPHEQIAFDITKFLRKTMFSPTIPFPNNIVISKWSCNPYTYGAKCFMKLGSTTGHIKDLYDAEVASCGTLSPLLFAGEATDSKYYGTLNGARMSGLRQAVRIMRYIQQKYVSTQENTKEKEEDNIDEDEICKTNQYGN